MQSVIFCILIVISFLFSSCNAEMKEEVAKEQIYVQTQSIPVDFNASLYSFDAASIDTRAMSHTWKEGDVIYLLFTTVDGTTTGTVTYNSNAWIASFERALIRDTDTKCIAYYFDGQSTKEGSNVTITPTTGIYADLDASYFYHSNGKLSITCSLKPQTGRIRFKGIPGTSFSVAGLSCGSIFGESIGTISKSKAEVPLTIMSDGYSPYIYGDFTDNPQPEITVKYDNNTFVADCSKCPILYKGESGYMDLPIVENHKGWALKQIYRDHEYVDLGLPSGTLWATCNVGASSQEEYGSYYAWGEICTKSEYTYDNYIYKDIPPTLTLDNDVAHVNWGGNWRMPTVWEMRELLNECKWNKATIGGVNGCKVSSRKNNNYIFLPASGTDYSHSYNNICGDYWSSTSYIDDYVASFYHLSFWSDGVNVTCIFAPYEGLSVRPVFSPDK